MDLQKIQQYKSAFDAITKGIKDDDGNTIEVWYARELQTVLGYARWENFVGAIGRAMESCKTLGISIDDHFREVTKMIALAKGAQRDVQDFMLKRLGIKSGALADYLPTLTIAAKNLATEMTNYNVEQKDLYGEANITAEHVQNNRSVRGMLGQRGIKPENLPPAEDIKKVERKVAKDERLMQKDAQKLPKE